MSGQDKPTGKDLLKWGREQDARKAHEARKANERQQPKGR